MSLPAARDWQPTLGALGAVVVDTADLGQAIGIILTTPRGADPHRPTFGADVLAYLDQPEVTATPGLIAAAAEAILTWEPRVALVSITPTWGLGQVTLAVRWRRRGAGEDAAPYVTEVTL
jgi:uncharacterized protein